MLFILFILAIACAIFYIIRDRLEWVEHLIESVICLFFIFMVFGIITAIAPEIEDSRINCSYPIFSLKTTDKIEGQFFFLGSGYIQNQEYYYFFAKDSQGAFIREQVKVDNSRIFEQNNGQPKIIWQRINFRFSKWIVPWNQASSTEDTIHDLYVPTGTVIQKFNVQ